MTPREKENHILELLSKEHSEQDLKEALAWATERAGRNTLVVEFEPVKSILRLMIASPYFHLKDVPFGIGWFMASEMHKNPLRVLWLYDAGDHVARHFAKMNEMLLCDMIGMVADVDDESEEDRSGQQDEMLAAFLHSLAAVESDEDKAIWRFIRNLKSCLAGMNRALVITAMVDDLGKGLVKTEDRLERQMAIYRTLEEVQRTTGIRSSFPHPMDFLFQP